MAKQNCLLLILAAILDFGIKKCMKILFGRTYLLLLLFSVSYKLDKKKVLMSTFEPETFENRNILKNLFGDFKKRVSGSVHTLNFSFLPLKLCFVWTTEY